MTVTAPSCRQGPYGADEYGVWDTVLDNYEVLRFGNSEFSRHFFVLPSDNGGMLTAKQEPTSNAESPKG